MDDQKRSSYIDFINRSFRDIADKDYIIARLLYKFELGGQFLWSSQQALEKYLKAILLYSDKSTKKIGHDIQIAFHDLEKIKDIPFSFPNDVINFIEYLNNQGENRYFIKPAYTTGDELLMLDKTVWFIRKYCFYMKGESTPGPDGKRIRLFPLNIKLVQSVDEKNANKYSISGGYIEKILNDKKSKIREFLIWKNSYYGVYKKKIIKNFIKYSWSSNPTHYLNPEIFSFLESRVKFSEEVRKYFQELNNNI